MPDKIHICKECQFEIERNGHSPECSYKETIEQQEQRLNLNLREMGIK